MTGSGWLLSQSRAARWAQPDLGVGHLLGDLAAQPRPVACPRMAAMLNHLCASIRSIATPAPIE